MRALILAFVGGIALTVSTQGASLAPKPALGLGTAALIEPADQACGWGWHRVPDGATNGVICIGVTAFRTEEAAAAGMQGRTTLPRVARSTSAVGLQ